MPLIRLRMVDLPDPFGPNQPVYAAAIDVDGQSVDRSQSAEALGQVVESRANSWQGNLGIVGSRAASGQLADEGRAREPSRNSVGRQPQGQPEAAPRTGSDTSPGRYAEPSGRKVRSTAPSGQAGDRALAADHDHRENEHRDVEGEVIRADEAHPKWADSAPPYPAKTAEMTKARILVYVTSMPTTLAASSSSRTASKLCPILLFLRRMRAKMATAMESMQMSR